MTTKQQDLEHVGKFLTDHTQMSASTSSNYPWIFTAYYTTDKDLNLYFLTSPKTIHAGQIATNPKIAVAIADSPQDLMGKKAGLQMSGLCTQLNDESEIRTALKLWRTKLNVENPDYTYESMQAGKISGRMYKIVPKKIKFFNEHLQEEGEERLIEL